MDIYGAFQICSIGVLVALVTVRQSPRYFNDLGRNTIFVWASLVLAGKQCLHHIVCCTLTLGCLVKACSALLSSSTAAMHHFAQMQIPAGRVVFHTATLHAVLFATPLKGPFHPYEVVQATISTLFPLHTSSRLTRPQSCRLRAGFQLFSCWYPCGSPSLRSSGRSGTNMTRRQSQQVSADWPSDLERCSGPHLMAGRLASSGVLANYSASLWRTLTSRCLPPLYWPFSSSARGTFLVTQYDIKWSR